MSRIERAVLSVSDKAGLIDFARGLSAMGVELLSTGGTARALREAGLDVRDVTDFTGFPEMMDGRVKTLHPRVHAGLLNVRDNADHQRQMAEQGMVNIDLVCVNLYPFEATVARAGISFEEAVEQIDIGGPTMIRSAAKNMRDVTVVIDPADYGRVLAEMAAHEGGTSKAFRLELGQKVFARMAAYNAAIASYLADQLPAGAPRPFVVACGGGEPLRYGENPHQSALFYREGGVGEACVAETELLHGKEMSFNNYVDGNAALEVAKELAGRPGVAIIKHTNPCGYATGETLAEAFEAAWAGDTVSAFGSVIALTERVDAATAECLKGRFVEALIAPEFEDAALEILKARSRNVRLLRLKHPVALPGSGGVGRDVKQIHGGWLVQQRDIGLADKFESVTERPFPESMRALAEFGMKACKHVKSNAIVLVREYRPGCYSLLGMGAGQPNRVDATRKLALARARENIEALHRQDSGGLDFDAFYRQIMEGVVLVSDAFFPFADNVEVAAGAGVRYLVEPGGSVRDDEVVAAADRLGVAMAFTGMRHFKH